MNTSFIHLDCILRIFHFLHIMAISNENHLVWYKVLFMYLSWTFVDDLSPWFWPSQIISTIYHSYNASRIFFCIKKVNNWKPEASDKSQSFFFPNPRWERSQKFSRSQLSLSLSPSLFFFESITTLRWPYAWAPCTGLHNQSLCLVTFVSTISSFPFFSAWNAYQLIPVNFSRWLSLVYLKGRVLSRSTLYLRK